MKVNVRTKMRSDGKEGRNVPTVSGDDVNRKRKESLKNESRNEEQSENFPFVRQRSIAAIICSLSLHSSLFYQHVMITKGQCFYQVMSLEHFPHFSSYFSFSFLSFLCCLLSLRPKSL